MTTVAGHTPEARLAQEQAMIQTGAQSSVCGENDDAPWVPGLAALQDMRKDLHGQDFPAEEAELWVRSPGQFGAEDTVQFRGHTRGRELPNSGDTVKGFFRPCNKLPVCFTLQSTKSSKRGFMNNAFVYLKKHHVSQKDFLISFKQALLCI